MLTQGFRATRPGIPTASSILKRRQSTFLPHASAFHNSRTRVVSVAAIVAAASTTALASSQDNSLTKDPWRLNSAPSKTECETQTISEIFPEVILKYDHYNGVIVHLDWILQRPEVEDKLLTHSKPNGEQDAMTPERQQQLNQLYQDWSSDPTKFEDILKRSLQQWKVEGRKGIWIHVPKSMAGVVPACISNGFDFHSCQTKNQINAGTGTGSTNLILAQWLPTDVESRLPLGPYFQAGVGCVVFHPDDCSKMLVVQEITGPAAARKLWKMPTGLIDPGEDIAEAAERELKEETGLDGKCEGILAFRQAHGASAGRASSDLFFICLLTPKDGQQSSLDDLKPQEHEIKDIQWMTAEDYAGQETWQKSPVYLQLNQAILNAVEQQKQGKPMPMVAHSKLPVGWAGGTNTVYYSKL